MRQRKDFANLLALYTFYTYHAQQQKTNQPLATDEFTKKGMNWAIDRVKKTKRLLKEMKVIEVVQKERYSYIHLFFIYTKKKICDILGNNSKISKNTSIEKEEPKEKNEKSVFEKSLIKAQIAPKKIDKIKQTIQGIKEIKSYELNHIALARWVIYCEKNAIGYHKNNLKHWLDKLNNRTTIEQIEAVHQAIDKKWKDFYLVPIQKSKYHKFLGKSLMMKKDCDTLVDIGYENKKFIYQFKNIKVTTTEPPFELFNRYGYDRGDMKTAPIVTSIKDKIMGCFKKI